VEREARPRDAGAVAATVAGYLAGVEERARQAERERAAAEARAAEQRKRRRVQFALAATVLVLLGLVGFGLWWQERAEATAAAERAARDSRVTAGVTEALREARERAEEAWNLADFPDRMQHATDAAVAALGRGDGFASAGAPDDAILGKLASARGEVDQVARYTRLIKAAAAISEEFAEEVTGEGRWQPEARLARRFNKALIELGLDPLHEPVNEVASAVASSRLRDVLLGVMLHCHWHAKHEKRLWQVIRSARQLSGGAYARWQQLLDDRDVPGLVAFAASPDGLSFRSILISALFRDLRDARQYEACYRFLRAVLERYPHDVWSHYELSHICQRMKPPQYTEALRHSSAASVQWPDSPVFHLQLGDCYVRLGSYARAIASFRKSFELGQGARVGWIRILRIADDLIKKKDWNGALPAAQESIRLQPKSVVAHRKLAEILYASGKHAEALRTTVAAVREHPDLAETPGCYVRYFAACYALRCADGRWGKAPPQAECPAYRKQALDFLTAELASVRKGAAKNPAQVHNVMQLWLTAKDRASVREPMSLARLPVKERDAWNRLWAEVGDLRSQTTPQSQGKRDGRYEYGRKAKTHASERRVLIGHE
jgi:tetratricopeptide (TPR) repeat protein